ncbi:pentatricopeptide repeat-containing protein, partial [Trifolium medium]|nr:pentatricopeptide repeat-containing protein [Trifolium medium]
GVRADEVTLVAVLSACSHSGLLDKGRLIFNMLVDGKYGFYPNVKHYACMVDLLARGGRLREAYEIMRSLPRVVMILINGFRIIRGVDSGVTTSGTTAKTAKAAEKYKSSNSAQFIPTAKDKDILSTTTMAWRHSEDEARMMVYSVTKLAEDKYAFGTLLSAEISGRVDALPGVVMILAGDPFVNIKNIGLICIRDSPNKGYVGGGGAGQMLCEILVAKAVGFIYIIVYGH